MFGWVVAAFFFGIGVGGYLVYVSFDEVPLGARCSRCGKVQNESRPPTSL